MKQEEKTESDDTEKGSNTCRRVRNDSSDYTHAECRSEGQSGQETYETPQLRDGLFSEATSAEGGTTSSGDMDSLDSVVAGWRAGLEVRERGESDGGKFRIRDELAGFSGFANS